MSSTEKSRTCSSWICCCAGGTAFGTACSSQPFGLSSLAARSATRLRRESVDSATEYGSVTVLTTTCCTEGAQTFTWYR